MDEPSSTSGPPGSQGSGLGGSMETGPNAGAGPGGPDEEQDVAMEVRPPDVSPDGPVGPQDSSVRDLDEPG